MTGNPPDKSAELREELDRFSSATWYDGIVWGFFAGLIASGFIALAFFRSWPI